MKYEKCCESCKFFEPRNKFCRRFPPTPIVKDTENHYKSHTGEKGKRDFIISKYPVIAMPDLDWCGEFESSNVM